MSKKRSIIKWSLIGLFSLITLIVAFGLWFISLIPTETATNSIENIQPKDLSYLEDSKPFRGKVLAVVTSTSVMGETDKNTGYELTELSRSYYVFQANGFEVDVASPLGGEPPVIIDDEDMGIYDFAFLNDPIAQQKTKNTIAIEDVNSKDYVAVYFVGGKGAMFDFPQNEKIQALVREYYQSDRVIGAVCHGPAALVNVTLDDGSSLLENKTICSFTNSEELFLIPDAESIFPFLLQDKLEEKGARFSDGIMYLENVSQDGNLVTGQNPWSTWAMAETMVKQLGYTPKERTKTPEENAVHVLTLYERQGYSSAKKEIREFYSAEQKKMDRTLIAMHSIVAAMQWKIGKSFDLIGLLKYAKDAEENGVS